MIGSTCPRCQKVIRITKKNKQYTHRTPYGDYCPYSGVTQEDAANKVTHLARRLLDKGYVKSPVTGEWELKI